MPHPRVYVPRSLSLLLASYVLILSLPSFAELPPLSPEEQEEQATTIVTGRVKSLKHQTVRRDQNPEFLDDRVTVSFQVEKVLKGEKVRPGEAIRVHYWRAKQRPEGWAGPGGQYEPLKVGMQAKLFLKKGEHPYELLIPNGWVSLEKVREGGAAGR